MAGTTVRLSEQTRAKLRELANQTNESMQDVLAKAVEAYRREQFWQATSEAYAALRNDSVARAEYEEEISLWDTTLMDGLESEPYGDDSADG